MKNSSEAEFFNKIKLKDEDNNIEYRSIIMKDDLNSTLGKLKFNQKQTLNKEHIKFKLKKSVLKNKMTFIEKNKALSSKDYIKYFLLMNSKVVSKDALKNRLIQKRFGDYSNKFLISMILKHGTKKFNHIINNVVKMEVSHKKGLIPENVFNKPDSSLTSNGISSLDFDNVNFELIEEMQKIMKGQNLYEPKIKESKILLKKKKKLFSHFKLKDKNDKKEDVINETVRPSSKLQTSKLITSPLFSLPTDTNNINNSTLSNKFKTKRDIMCFDLENKNEKSLVTLEKAKLNLFKSSKTLNLFETKPLSSISSTKHTRNNFSHNFNKMPKFDIISKNTINKLNNLSKHKLYDNDSKATLKNGNENDLENKKERKITFKTSSFRNDTHIIPTKETLQTEKLQDNIYFAKGDFKNTIETSCTKKSIHKGKLVLKNSLNFDNNKIKLNLNKQISNKKLNKPTFSTLNSKDGSLNVSRSSNFNKIISNTNRPKSHDFTIQNIKLLEKRSNQLNNTLKIEKYNLDKYVRIRKFDNVKKNDPFMNMIPIEKSAKYIVIGDPNKPKYEVTPKEKNPQKFVKAIEAGKKINKLSNKSAYKFKGIIFNKISFLNQDNENSYNIQQSTGKLEKTDKVQNKLQFLLGAHLKKRSQLHEKYL